MGEINDQLCVNRAGVKQIPVIHNPVGAMKTKLLSTVLCVRAVLLSTANPGLASGTADTTSIIVDVAVARPVSLVLTIVGSALFVVTLPIAATSHSVDKTAHTLVVAPARDTFVRPVGDLDEFLDY